MAEVPGFELMYQTRNYDAGRPGKSVFTALANPPARAVAAEAAAAAALNERGTSVGPSRDVISGLYTNRDFIRDQADHVSIYRPEGD